MQAGEAMIKEKTYFSKIKAFFWFMHIIQYISNLLIMLCTHSCILGLTAPLTLQDLSTSSAEELTAGLKTLQQHSTALQNEIGHCDRVLSILHQLASQQVKCLTEWLPDEYNLCMHAMLDRTQQE